MCGIIGYIGDKKATPVLINGLLCLEYRGYDSAGIAVIEDGKITVMKDKGRVANLEAIDGINDLKSTIGIAHTRWATHGNLQKKILILIWIIAVNLQLCTMVLLKITMN